MMPRSALSLACFTMAGVWPWLVNTLGTALMSPLERATRDAICGAPVHGELVLLGHCATCWAGSAALIATGVVVLLSGEQRQRARQRTRS
jgi:hypothetical protein